MDKRSQAYESDPRHTDDARPVHEMPAPPVRRATDFTNEGPGEPVYNCEDRGYTGRG
jgi:hypothetical protein